MDAYKDSEPSRFALATRRAERSALSFSAGDGLCCAKAAVPAAQARRKSAGRDSMEQQALGGARNRGQTTFSTFGERLRKTWSVPGFNDCSFPRNAAART